MPSDAFTHFSDADLAAIIAYVKSVPPVDQATAPPRIGPVMRVLSVMFPIFRSCRLSTSIRAKHVRISDERRDG